MTDPNELDPSGELAVQIAAQAAEYGTYVANQRIYAGNALAYEVGHQVPVSNVVKHGYALNGQVTLVEGKQHPPEVLEGLRAAGMWTPAGPQEIPGQLAPGEADTPAPIDLAAPVDDAPAGGVI